MLTEAMIHEEASDDWHRLDLGMPSLVGTPAMQVGNLLWLDDGKRLLVGDVNLMFGAAAHCKHPVLPIVRAWRRLVDVPKLRQTPVESWATAFDLDGILFDYAEPDEYEAVGAIAQPMNDIISLDLDGSLQPGLFVSMEDGQMILVGHVNALAGTCDSQEGDRGGLEPRVARYLRVVPEGIFRPRPYRL